MARFSALFLLMLALCRCVAVPPPEGPWLAPLYQDHPLTGTLWRLDDGARIDEATLMDAVQASALLILGEKHDNPDHHALQLHVLRQLAESSTLGSVSFEMLDSGQAAALGAFVGRPAPGQEVLRTGLQWDEEGWDWSFYGPLLREALNAGVPVRTANISRSEMMSVYGGELDAATQASLNEAQRQRLEQDIDESHCGMLPQSQFAAMVRVQQARDAVMAQSLQSDSGAAGVQVLIAGNFHARRDLGAPNYLSTDAGPLLSLAFLEVQPGLLQVQDYLESFSATLPYDYVWFTPAVAAQDYCAGLRAAAPSAAQ
ncbi:MAG: ChaN family lipoprotein [Pseudomonadales bacterium]|nr:ChaN family lipoprotein [Pseudomonadales bacterium]MCP5330416.1 ChaN family lipoprotein [Pseudomonadales bacterium]MCP5343971.1 ChaN family lipoprotein [Pseudomonadales bacterium]